MNAVVVAHDYLTQRGGAERVALAMAQALPGCRILTTLYDPERTYPGFARFDVSTSALQRVGMFPRHFKTALPLYPAAIRAMGPVPAGVLVTSSTAFAHGLGSQGCHIAYIHSPPHWLWETDIYARGRRAQAALIRPLRRRFRQLDVAAAQRPHLLLTNSANSARKIAAAYGRSAEVMPPPVRARPASETHDDFFLVVSRLLPYKRVDLAIAAAGEIGVRLVVVGEGPELDRLRRIAGPGTEFRSAVSDTELDRLYARCQAVIVAGEEDLGLVPVEANAAGRPAVALARGGALETVVDGRTGVLFHEPEVAALASAMAAAAGRSWDAAALQGHAVNWSEEAFARRLRLLVEGFPEWCRRCGGPGLGREPLRRLLQFQGETIEVAA